MTKKVETRKELKSYQSIVTDHDSDDDDNNRSDNIDAAGHRCDEVMIAVLIACGVVAMVLLAFGNKVFGVITTTMPNISSSNSNELQQMMIVENIMSEDVTTVWCCAYNTPPAGSSECVNCEECGSSDGKFCPMKEPCVCT
jgi:hypothetical protein